MAMENTEVLLPAIRDNIGSNGGRLNFHLSARCFYAKSSTVVVRLLLNVPQLENVVVCVLL